MRSKSSRPIWATATAFCAISSCCQPWAIARSSAIRVVGPASSTRRAAPSAISSGSLSRADAKKGSPGRKSTTNSGEPGASTSRLRPASSSRWRRTCRAWSAICSSRSASLGRFAGGEVGAERRLGVDRDDAIAGQAHDQVGRRPPPSPPGRGWTLPGADRVSRASSARRSRSVRACRRARRRGAAGARPSGRGRSVCAGPGRDCASPSRAGDSRSRPARDVESGIGGGPGAGSRPAGAWRRPGRGSRGAGGPGLRRPPRAARARRRSRARGSRGARRRDAGSARSSGRGRGRRALRSGRAGADSGAPGCAP